MVKLILMTGVMVSLFTSATILAQNSNTTIAFAKRDTGTTTTATTTPHTTDTGTSKTGKDTTRSGSGSTSTSTSTPNPASTDNGDGHSGNVANSARPPGQSSLHGFPDKLHCPKGQQVYEVGGVCQTKPHICNVSGPDPNCCATAQTAASLAKCKPPTPTTPHCPSGSRYIITLGYVKKHLTYKEA